MDAEQVKPYDSQRPKAEQVEQMFDSIAPAYDFMNRAMTLGIDKLWRAKAVRMLRQEHPRRILDIATGTGDLAIKLARSIDGCHVDGVDLSQGMIEIGRRKVADAGLESRITLDVGDCLDLKIADDSYDAITVAYGVRNFEHLLTGYQEMARVLRPGGRLCVIELSTPRGWLVRPLYRFYTKVIIPALGRLISKDVRAYSYLPESIEAVPQGETMIELMRRAGLVRCHYRPLTFGVCTIYTAYKECDAVM